MPGRRSGRHGPQGGEVTSGLAPASVILTSEVRQGPSGRFEDGQHRRGPAEQEQPTAVGGDVLVVAGAGSEEVAEFVVSPNTGHIVFLSSGKPSEKAL